MENYSIREIIEQAIQTEELGYHFYNQMAEKFNEHSDLKELFSELAGKELEHKAVFSDIMDETEAADAEYDGWEEVSHYMRAVVESEFFLGKHKIPPVMDRITTVDEAVRLAIAFEKETMLYFIGLRDLVKQKDIIDSIINEERRHIVLLSPFSRRIAG